MTLPLKKLKTIYSPIVYGTVIDEEKFDKGKYKGKMFKEILENDIVYSIDMINKKHGKQQKQLHRFVKYAKYKLSCP